MDENGGHEEALGAIERLHLADMAASKAGDFRALRALMSDDAVVMPPGGRATRGREALDASFARMEGSMATVEVLEYVLDFEEVKVLGDYAFEWGTIRGAMRPRGGGEIERSSYHVMRILQRQRDGEWKVHRTIWNETKGNDER
jgi:uncharacterized protein (TIGR02246 family)